MYRERLASEWRAAVAVDVTAVLIAVAAQLPLGFDARWLLVGLGVVVVVAVGNVLLAIGRCSLPADVSPAPFRTREVAAAAKAVSRGRSVDPPELQAAGIDRARRGLRTLPLTAGWQPVSGCVWVLGLDERLSVFVVFWAVASALSLAALAHSGLVQRRLDALEATGSASRAANAAPHGTGPVGEASTVNRDNEG